MVLLPDLSDQEVSQIDERLRTVKRPGDLTVLSIHRGKNWGYQIPRKQRRFARQLIDVAGVDLVYGHSSHHPKAIEVHQGNPVLYGSNDSSRDQTISIASGCRSGRFLDTRQTEPRRLKGRTRG